MIEEKKLMVLHDIVDSASSHAWKSFLSGTMGHALMWWGFPLYKIGFGYFVFVNPKVGAVSSQGLPPQDLLSVPSHLVPRKI